MSRQQFTIFDISSQERQETEAMGTKKKFWLKHSDLGICLYKKCRENTGEDWAEKIAAELCNLIKLPHANYELAKFNDENGIISPSFLSAKNSTLTTGNEILAKLLLNYPKSTASPSEHTVDNIFKVFNSSDVLLPMDWTAPKDISKATDVFIGYLLLDAWIGNSDRHHENWAFINLQQKSYLAPTYDHASSLGRTESDEKRYNRLTTRDEGYTVEAYTNKCKSCLYARVGDTKPLGTFEAFCEAAKLYPKSANIWLNLLANVSQDSTLALFNRIPQERISPKAIEFAQKILEINQNRLIEFSKKI